MKDYGTTAPAPASKPATPATFTGKIGAAIGGLFKTTQTAAKEADKALKGSAAERSSLTTPKPGSTR